MFKFRSGFAVAVFTAMAIAVPAQADTVKLTFTELAGTTTGGTVVYRADLSQLTMGEIQSLTLTDSNSKYGGSPGEYSGFDLDGIKISSTFATTATQAAGAVGLSVFDFSPSGTFFTPGTQRTPVAAHLHGQDGVTKNVDWGFATLGALDSVMWSNGSLTLGDGGSIAFNTTAPIQTSGLYLYIGEVGGGGEMVAGTMYASALPVPEPDSWALLMMGLLIVPAFLRKRTMNRQFGAGRLPEIPG